MDPVISVIIPVYNVEPYIRQCLDSIVNQTYRNLEIIIIDDGSPDRCGEICDEYAAKDGRISVVHKKNGGLSAARNDGIMRATGKWITFVDSDDWCELDYYEQFIKAIGNSHPDVFQAGGFIFEYPQRQQIQYSFQVPFHAYGKDNIVEIMKDIFRIGLPWDKLYRTDFIRENHLLFDMSSKAFEDHLFNFQLFSCAENISGSVFVGYHYRQVAMSISKGYNPNKPKINYSFLTKLHRFISEQKLPEDVRVAAYTDAILAINITLSCYYFHAQNPKSYRETAKEIKSVKEWPYYHQAIWDGNSQYLTPKQRILKYALRLPWVYPVKILYTWNMKIKTLRNN